MVGHIHAYVVQIVWQVVQRMRQHAVLAGLGDADQLHVLLAAGFEQVEVRLQYADGQVGVRRAPQLPVQRLQRIQQMGQRRVQGAIQDEGLARQQADVVQR